MLALTKGAAGCSARSRALIRNWMITCRLFMEVFSWVFKCLISERKRKMWRVYLHGDCYPGEGPVSVNNSIKQFYNLCFSHSFISSLWNTHVVWEVSSITKKNCLQKEKEADQPSEAGGSMCEKEMIETRTEWQKQMTANKWSWKAVKWSRRLLALTSVVTTLLGWFTFSA